MATDNSPPNAVNTEQTLHQPDQVTDAPSEKKYEHTTEQKLYSQQPRFSTNEIIQKFPNITNRYCHKIGFSIPWHGEHESPNKETYFSAIKYLFNILKEYDTTFQILPWNITKRECNPIVDSNLIPTSHEELQDYVYDLHLHPTRVRASMVVTSTFNLDNLFKNHPRGSKKGAELIRFMHKEKLFFKTLSIQTLGEIKLVGFLQFVHPHFTNMKRLLADIQSILETKDVVLELYRPRATDKDNKQIAAPEAIAIGAPCDISIGVYKSLIEKWSDIIDGEYDIVIGNDSVLKESYFIPFSHNLLNKKARNQAVLNHCDFMNEYTSIQIRRCGSIDIKFKLTEDEIKEINYEFDEGTEQEITLRDIINCWTELDTPELLVKTIQNCAGNTKTLLIKKVHKKRITNKIGRLLEILEKRSDFNIICGNSQDYGASIGKFTISKNGRNYLSSLRSRKLNTEQQSFLSNEETGSESNTTKRKRHLTVSTSIPKSDTSTTSPIYKKGTHNNPPSSISSTTTTSMPSYSSVVKTAPAERHNNNTNTEQKEDENQDVNTTPTMNNSNNFTSALTVLQSSTRPNNSSERVVRFVDGSTAEMTMSTMSTEDRLVVLNQQRDLTIMMEKQIKDIASAMSQKYESTIQDMRNSHIAEMNVIRTKQQEHEHEIEQLQTTQEKIKVNLEEKLDNKIEQQTNLLSSLVTMVYEMKEDKNKSSTLQESNEQKPTQPPTKKDITNSGDLTDCSYSEEEDTLETGVQKVLVHSPVLEIRNSDITTVLSQSKKEVNSSKQVAQSSRKCDKHTNHIEYDDSDDIRRRTRSSLISTNKDSSQKWKGISASTKRAIKLQHAIISPTKHKKKENLYNKNSPT